MKAKKCKHTLWWTMRRERHGDGWRRIKCPSDEATFAVCCTCNAWLSLGPAEDGGEHAEAVAIEVRAAELAEINDTSKMSDDGFLGHLYAMKSLLGNDGDPRLRDEMPDTAEHWAGYLSGFIWSHDHNHAGIADHDNKERT